MANLRGESDIGMGNVIGSNLFNLLFVLGLAATIHPITLDPASLIGTYIDFGIAALFTAALIPIALTSNRVSRWEGVGLLSAYIGYMTYTVVGS